LFTTAVTVALAFVLAGCAARVPVSGPRAEPVVLAVVSWNMNAGRGDLPRLVDDLSSGALTGTLARDYVVLLQEVVEPGVTDLVSFARERSLSMFFVPVRTHRQRTTGNAILSTSPLGDRRGIELPRERQSRGAAAAGITVAGEHLFVVSTHLENRVGLLRGALFSDHARGRQAAALLRALPDDRYGIAGGDFNTWLGHSEPAWRAFAERFPDTPSDGFEPTFRDRLVLDHVFFHLPPGWQAHRWVSADRYGSDHHPVVGTIAVVEDW
jgi:endonuclease/exonuclease/phosphatase family metal-dependent hydrolase